MSDFHSAMLLVWLLQSVIPNGWYPKIFSMLLHTDRAKQTPNNK